MLQTGPGSVQGRSSDQILGWQHWRRGTVLPASSMDWLSAPNGREVADRNPYAAACWSGLDRKPPELLLTPGKLLSLLVLAGTGSSVAPACCSAWELHLRRCLGCLTCWHWRTPESLRQGVFSDWRATCMWPTCKTICWWVVGGGWWWWMVVVGGNATFVL